MQGEISNANREINAPSYIVDGDPGRAGGGTYTHPGNARSDPTIQDYENIFGPAARDVKLDLQRNKRHARWHLPDALRGSNPWIADKIDGLITDTSASPFTTEILPYMYIENVDQKIKWNRWSFDEGLSSRVPYESAARTLTQTKTSYAGYTVRQGLAITLEHNFMMSPKGRENFKNQLQQIVGSIQYTNDIDVHIALITAPSYAKEKAEKYYTRAKTNHQIMREYIDLFGFMQKNPNAMDIMIEEAKSVLRSWGAAEPSFLLTNSKLTFQMTMIPEKTEYISQGPDGTKRLKAGPNIGSYRGLKIINSRSFSMEDGAPPRDVLRRRVRTAEYYRIPWSADVHQKSFSFYDEAKDAWQKFSWNDLFRMAQCQKTGQDRDDEDGLGTVEFVTTKLPDRSGPDAPAGVFHPERQDLSISVRVWENMCYESMRGAQGGRDIFDGISAEVTGGDVLPVLQGYGAVEPPVPGLTPESLRGIWGAADPDNPVTKDDEPGVYRAFLQDLKDFMMGRRSYLNPEKMAVLSLLNLYTRYQIILQVIFDFNIWPAPPNSLVEQLIAEGVGNPINHIYNTLIKRLEKAKWEIVVVRPNIEHNMLGVVMGRGGIDELGATLWGQTELSVYDDSMHGIWGMSYKYNERAIVFNHKNLIRLWDIAYDGYNGGKDCTCVNWSSDDDLEYFRQQTYELNKSYEGPSMMVMRFKNVDTSDPWPSPIVFHDTLYDQQGGGSNYIDGEHQHQIKKDALRVFNRAAYRAEYQNYIGLMPDFSRIHNPKNAGTCSEENETSCNCLAFQGTMRIQSLNNAHLISIHSQGTMRIHTPNNALEDITGNGHHGVDAVGMASVRSGKGIAMGSLNSGAVVTKII